MYITEHNCEECLKDNPYSESMAECEHNGRFLCVDCIENEYFDAVRVLVDPANQGFEIEFDIYRDEDGKLESIPVSYKVMNSDFSAVLKIEDVERIKHTGSVD